MKDCKLSFLHLEEIFELALERGYQIIKCEEYLSCKRVSHGKLLVNRIDIDFWCPGAARIAEIFNRLGIKGTFFIRLHAEEYNPFSIENYRYLKFIRDSSHEIGLHSEVVGTSERWKIPPEKLLINDIEILNKMLDIKLIGIASHREGECSNLDFWTGRKPSDFGLSYEAYDNHPTFNLFDESVYISDSEYTHWKCYRNGILDESDKRCLCRHLEDGNKIIYTLIHPITYKE